jgi:hypothetical protein
MPRPRLRSHQKSEVKREARDCCEYCGAQEAYSPDTFSIEHIQPIAKGGTSGFANLANACQGCNNRKYTRVEAIDPLTGDLVPLYHPRRERWAVHFTWNEDFTRMLGLSPTGRATIEALALNRKGVVNLRRLLHKLGLHPLEDEA